VFLSPLKRLLVKEFVLVVILYQGTAVAQWLRYCATNQKVAGSISDGVMEFFNDINPSDRTMALGSTQPLTERSTRSISWG
jgi:membrane-bound lytic murein transglycosylase B